MNYKQLEDNTIIVDKIENLIGSINYRMKEDTKSFSEIVEDIKDDERDKKAFYIGFDDTDLRILQYCLNKTLDIISLKDKFLGMIKEEASKFKDAELSETAIGIAIESLSRFHSPPDRVVSTVDGGIQFIFYIDDRCIELEIFNDGDIVFSEDDVVTDVPYEQQLYKIINLINKWIDEYE